MAGQAWFSPLGTRGAVKGDGNGAPLDWWSAGMAGGYQQAVAFADGDASMGVGLGYLRGRGTVDARGSNFDTDGFLAGVYGAWSDGPWSLSGALAYAANHVASQRRIAIGGLSPTATAGYWTHAVGLSAEAAYALDLGNGTTLSPLATFDTGWAGHGGFAETGAGAFNLTAAAESRLRLDLGLGLAFAHTVLLESGTVTFEGRVLWEHGFADLVPNQTMAFAGGPSGFEVRGPASDRDRLRLGLGVSYVPAESMELRASYTGLLSGSQQSHSATLGLNMKF